MRPGYTQTDVTHPVLGSGGANVGLQHLGRIPNCSEVPHTYFLWYFVQFLFFFLLLRATSDFFRGCTNSHWGFLHGPLGKMLGIYPVAARDIAWDFSGGRSGYRLGFIRWKALGIFPVAAQEIP